LASAAADGTPGGTIPFVPPGVLVIAGANGVGGPTAGFAGGGGAAGGIFAAVTDMRASSAPGVGGSGFVEAGGSMNSRASAAVAML
jgi:hypothetical protein